MKVITSRSTVLIKWVFPVAWFGFLTYFLFLSVSTGIAQQDKMFLLGPLAMAVFGFIFMKKMFWDLMDEVVDCDDHLQVRNRGQQETIYLSNVMNVSATTHQNPTRITLRLRVPCKFGENVSFYPAIQFSLNPFRKNDVFEDLVVRCDRARGGR